ncbi:MAG: UDP-N-acetylglucosamine 4,6-dehydratase (inverting) [Deltaproteobacteria bacterium]|nr:UDP-N-acetylglucosamine 4,6-dehydratase (inverting) [Deltaproteobacteria bacterium]
MRYFEGKTVLITGGTGSLGKMLCRLLLRESRVRKVIVYSRDELKQFELSQLTGIGDDERIRFFLGDVRDADRLSRALDGVELIIHAAALKQVPAAEYNPFEAVKTNILGAQNVIEAAIDKKVTRVIALSTDKAANPVNLYGATKLCSDKLFVAGNAYVGPRATRFAVVRYGNVMGSRGSVVPLFLRLRREGRLPITDSRMTRFWITLEQAGRFVLDCLTHMSGGELYVPKLPSTRMTDIARVISPDARIDVIGIRPGEKLHEVMIPEDEARKAVDVGDRYVILPPVEWQAPDRMVTGTPCPEGFRYASDNNDQWLNEDRLGKMIAALDLPEAKEWARERGVA